MLNLVEFLCNLLKPLVPGTEFCLVKVFSNLMESLLSSFHGQQPPHFHIPQEEKSWITKFIGEGWVIKDV